MPNSGPLVGIRVIDFGRFIAGPHCGMLLADMGADIIRVDRRQGSEDRYPGPVTEGGEGGAFISLNRNKRSLTLDTSRPGSNEIIRRLVKKADVVLADRHVLGTERQQRGNAGFFTAPADAYRAQDGWLIVLVIGTDMFARWARLVGREDFISDPRFADDLLRADNRELITNAMNAWLANRTMAEAITELEKARIPAGPVLDLGQVLEDPQVKARELLRYVEYPVAPK